MGRAPCCDKTKVKRGPWSPEEDSLLKDYIHTHGTVSNWIALPRKAGLNRCGKSCRLRWLNYLRPDIIHGGFTEEEDSLICTLYFAIGSRWSVIASKLPGRTDNDVKNYWNTKLKKKIMAGKVRGFEGASTYNNVGYNMSGCTGLPELDSTRFVQIKQEQGTDIDHVANYCDDGRSLMHYFSAWDAPIQDRNGICEEISRASELSSSRCTSSDDQNSSWGSVHTDDFWLGLLQVDQSTFMPGSSQILDGSVFPNQF